MNRLTGIIVAVLGSSGCRSRIYKDFAESGCDRHLSDFARRTFVRAEFYSDARSDRIGADVFAGKTVKNVLRADGSF